MDLAVSRDPSSRLSRIKTLITEAERELDRLKSEFVSQSASNSSGVKDAERKFKRGEKRVHLYKKMLLNYEAASKEKLIHVLFVFVAAHNYSHGIQLENDML